MTEREITGTLEDWWFDNSNTVYWGYVYGDIRNRFRDGSYIHTSRVIKVDNEENVIHTLNSVYKLGAKAKTLGVLEEEAS